MSVRRNLNIADGQLAATATELIAGQSDDGCWVNVTFCNTGDKDETIILTLTRGSSGTARRIRRFVLRENWQAVVKGQPLNSADSLKGYTTNALKVDYTVSAAAEKEIREGLDFRLYDDTGADVTESASLDSIADSMGTAVDHWEDIAETLSTLSIAAVEVPERLQQLLLALAE